MARSIQLPQGIADLVKAGGTPLTITGVELENGTPVGVAQYVIYLDDGVVRSVPEAGWPTEEARLAQKAADRDAARQLRQTIIQTAQSAVGVRIDQLTAAQIRALYALTLFDLGALTNQGVVKPLAEWVK